jgi:uncharacterized protein YjbI with pentapeptide repeats
MCKRQGTARWGARVQLLGAGGLLDGACDESRPLLRAVLGRRQTAEAGILARFDALGACLLSQADGSGPRVGAVAWVASRLGVEPLRGANLRGANLRGANLRGANLGDADLRGADLGDADLGDSTNSAVARGGY